MQKGFPETLQELYLLLLRHARPPIDGPAILDWLLGHTGLWSAVICGRMPQKIWPERPEKAGKAIHTPGSLRHLRGLARGEWDADRIWLLPAEGKEATLALVAQGAAWGATVTIGPEDAREMHTPADLITLRWETPPAPSDPLPAPRERPRSRRPPSMVDIPPLDLSLELIRRTGFNDFDGARVVRDLEAHSDLWRSAWLGISDSVIEERGQRLHPVPVFNTLECLMDEENAGHNADQLWVLCPSLEAARGLVRVSKKGWNVYPASTLIWNRASSRQAAGCVGDERVVSFWWS
jgi:hypothetical protein